MDGYAASISDVRRADAVMEALDHAGFSIVPKIAEGRIDAIYEAASTGSWAGIFEREWKAWTAAIHAGYVSKNTAVAPAKPGKETGRVVVLDEAGERKLQDLLAGKIVPTGRIIEVTYGNPDGTTRTQRHAEFGSLDKVSYDPPPVVGSEISGATVLKATETVGQDAPAITRDLVLFNCEDYEGNAAAADALWLDSYPSDDPVTLGWLIDEHSAYRQTVETLFSELTNGCVSKPNTDLDVVRELMAKANVVNLLEEHPKLAEDPLFRPVMDQHFDASEISGAVEIARLRLDGNRIVRIGTFGTFNLGKDAA